MDGDILLKNLDRVHSTEMGVDRIKRNLKLNDENAVEFCKDKIADPRCDITLKGKNYYCDIEGMIITVNARSFTIITAHKKSK